MAGAGEEERAREGAAHGQPLEGEKKGVKNVGAEETGGKNRAVSTEAAGVCRERKGGREKDRGNRGGGRQERSWRRKRAGRRRMVDRHKGEEKSGDGERSGRKIESARKTKR